MKNKNIILGFIIVIVVCLVTTGCGLKNSIDSKEFKEHFSALGYNVSETETPKYDADKYLVATKEELPYKIEYYEFKEEVDAKKVYEKYKNTIGDYITTNSNNTETSGVSFTKIVAVSENEYIIISRTKKTLIFIATTKDYQSEVDKLLEEIDY